MIKAKKNERAWEKQIIFGVHIFEYCQSYPIYHGDIGKPKCLLETGARKKHNCYRLGKCKVDVINNSEL